MSVRRPKLIVTSRDKKSQECFSAFFGVKPSVPSSRESHPLSSPPKSSVTNVSSSSLLSSFSSKSSFDDVQSSDTSYDSIEVHNFSNPFLTRSFKSSVPEEMTPRDLSLSTSNVKYESRSTQSDQPCSLKRSGSDILTATGQARKVQKKSLFQSTLQTNEAMSGLSTEQSSVVRSVVDAHESLFYTGSAGTGKSVVLRKLMQLLQRQYGARAGFTASTGMAACNIGGQTLHKFLGIGLGNGTAIAIASRIKKRYEVLYRWQTLKVLVIDEISMIDGLLFDKLNLVAKILRNNDKPFGGIQVVCTGDFFQLPPVCKNGEPLYCFDTMAWKETFAKTIVLTKVFRQLGDTELVDMLNALRDGNMDPETIAKFHELSRPVIYEDQVEPTELYPTRFEVKNANSRRLSRLPSFPCTYKAIDSSTDPKDQPQLDNLMCEKEVTLKEGAQVMYLKNLDDTVVNGSIGKVAAFTTKEMHAKMTGVDGYDYSAESLRLLRYFSHRIHSLSRTPADDAFARNVPAHRRKLFESLNNLAMKATPENLLPLVCFKEAELDRYELVEREKFSTSAANNTKQEGPTREQLPLILAWAMSIHKAQGQTIQRLRIDLGRTFEKGQVYVALSRAVSKESLEVRNFHPAKVTVSTQVRKFYAELATAK